MAKAGHFALVKVSGNSVVFTDESTSTTDDQTYRIDDETKTPWCRDCTITVKEDGVATTESFTLNRLTGQIIFDVVDVGRGVITVSGEFLPTSTLSEAFEFDYSIEANNEDITHFEQTWINRKQLLKDFSGSVGQFDSIDRTLFDNLNAGTTFVIEFFHDRTLGDTEWDLRAWVLIGSDEFSGSVDSVIEQSVDFEGNTDDDGRTVSNNP